MRREERIEDIEIGGKNVVIYELRPRDLLNFGLKINSIISDLSTETLLQGQPILDDVLAATTNLTMESILDLGFSEIDKIVETYQEVNKSFLAKLDWLGLKEKASQLVKKLWE